MRVQERGSRDLPGHRVKNTKDEGGVQGGLGGPGVSGGVQGF